VLAHAAARAFRVDFPEFSSAPNTGAASIHVFQKAKRTNLAKVNAQISVSATSLPPKVAGFLSNSMREASLGRVCMTAAGPQAVLKALKAIFLSRHHLRDEGIDVSIVPEFGKSEEGLSLINIFCLSHQVDGAI